MGDGDTKAELEASCLSPTPVGRFGSVGPKDGGCVCVSLCVLCFWVQRDEGCPHGGAGPRRLSLVGNPGQLGTSIHSNFYRHVRTWDPVSSVAFFFFLKQQSVLNGTSHVRVCIFVTD